jgi:hypothetical protein
MVTTGLLVRLEANPARAAEVERLLRDGLGRLAAALLTRASELLAHPPTIERVDVLAFKLPA